MPQITQGFDDVAPVTGVLNYGDYTNDTAPVIRVGLTGENVAGDSIRLSDNGTPAGAAATLTAADISSGYVDIPLAGLGPDWHLLTAASVAADGTVKATSSQWALGVATAIPAAPSISAATDDAGAQTGPLADGARTDDATPVFQLFEQGLPDPPTTSPGHAPYGGPALLSGTIRLYDGATLVASGQMGFGGTVTLTSDPLAAGDHTLTAVMTDRAGNVSAASAPFHLTIGLDGGGGQETANRPTPDNDVLQAGAGFTSVEGGPGDDTITGWSGGDRLRGGEGSDVIDGGSGFDDENGNVGFDTLHGGGGDDWVAGGRDNDVLSGDDGRDLVLGNLGADSCGGGTGADTIRGGQGDDVIVGGEGDDRLWGDRGDDTLTGGPGADTFHSFPGAGLDTITDFNASEGDRLVLDGEHFYTASQHGADAYVDFESGSRVVLQNVNLLTLPADWLVTA